MIERAKTFVVAKPDRLINMNDRSRWARINGNIAWRDAAFWWAKQHHLMCRRAVSLVIVDVAFGTNRPKARRDPHNFYPTIKAILDGFTTAAVWADDDSEHVRTNEPTFTDTVPADSLRITLAWTEI